MDWSLVEAARDLGATPLKAFLTVTLKLTLPGLLSGVILTFIPSMGLFFIADILGGNKVVLVGSLIQDQLMKAHNWPFAAALSVVLMILTSLMISLYKRVTHTTELEASYENRTKLPNIYIALSRPFCICIVLVIIYRSTKARSARCGAAFLSMVRNAVQGRRHVRGAGQQHRSGAVRSLGAAVIGTLCLRLHQGAASHQKCRGICVHASHHDPRDHPGMVFMTFFALIGLPFGMTTLILAHTAFCVPYVYMLVKARLVGMDKSLAEAARDLGAGEVRVFFDITLPLLVPAILSGMLLSFAMSLDDVIISIFVTGAT